MKHSPTPWKIMDNETDCITIVDANDCPVLQLWSKSEESYDNAQQNAQRVIDCVNSMHEPTYIGDVRLLLERANTTISVMENMVVKYDQLLYKLHKRCLGNDGYEQSELYKQVDAQLQMLDTNSIQHGRAKANNTEQETD